MNGWDITWLQSFGPTVGLAALLFIMQARGHLVPKRLHDQVRQDRDTALKAAETALDAAAQASANVAKLTEVANKLATNSEEQLGLQRRTLDTLSRLVPDDRSAA